MCVKACQFSHLLFLITGLTKSLIVNVTRRGLHSYRDTATSHSQSLMKRRLVRPHCLGLWLL